MTIFLVLTEGMVQLVNQVRAHITNRLHLYTTVSNNLANIKDYNTKLPLVFWGPLGPFP